MKKYIIVLLGLFSYDLTKERARVYVFRQRIISVFRGRSEEKKALPLLSLKPKGGLGKNSIYTMQLNEALNQPDIQNIALTGSYGAGKSSILIGIDGYETDKVLSISFSSLGANIQGYIQQEVDKTKSSKLTDIANLIQKEVLKQILFREEKHSLPDSNFLRIAKPKILPKFATSLIMTVVTFLVLAYFNIGDKFAAIFHITELTVQLLLIADLFLVMLLSYLLLLLTLGSRISISKIGGASVSLSLALKDKNSYFDEYLTEILYFFEVTKYEVVIFEDIDRFENLYIFENLRQLNTILNSSKQVGKNIKFIYAVKDSIFTKSVLEKALPKPKKDSKGILPSDEANDFSLDDENIYNRTKFFDLIIPVVPFITSTSSKDHMLQLFGKDEEVDLKGPVTTISRHISDMRLVKNIHNEYLIFKDMIYQDGIGLKLSNLFAIVVYKNINLEDFELIKKGDSKLNKISNLFLTEKNRQLSDIRSEITAKQRELMNIDSISRRAEEFGGLLTSYIENTIAQLSGTLNTISFESQTVTKSEFTTKDFWETVINGDKINLIISYRSGYSGYVENLTIQKSDLSRIINDNLNTDEWNSLDRRAAEAEINSLEEKMKFLRFIGLSGGLSHLIGYRKQVQEILGADVLTYDLIQEGYIDENFINYTSLYQDTNVSLQARAFIITNVNTNTISPLYEFKSETDIDNMLSQIGVSGIVSKGMFNLKIFDHILKNKLEKRTSLILDNFNESDQEVLDFFNLYLREGKEPEELVKQLASRWNKTIEFLGENNTLLDEDKAHLLNVVLKRPGADRFTSSSYFVKLVSNMPELFEVLKSFSRVDIVSRYLDNLQNFNIKFRDLDRLGDISKKIAIERQMYQINGANFKTLTDSTCPALDELNDAYPDVYNYVIENIDDYIKVLKSDESNISILSQPVKIIKDLSSVSQQQIEPILLRVKRDASKIKDINEISPNVWSLIFEHKLIENELANVMSYFNYYSNSEGGNPVLNEELTAFILSNDAIKIDKDLEDYNKAERQKLSVAILNASEISDEQKIKIASEVYADGYLEPAEISLNTELVFGLLKNEMIQDNSANLNYVQENYPECLESYVAASLEISTYLSSVTLNSNSIDSILKSKRISNDVRDYFVDNLGGLSSLISSDAKALIADYCADNKKALSFEQIILLAAPASYVSVAKLIVASSQNISQLQLFEILNSMGGEFKKLTRTHQRPSFRAAPEYLALFDDMKSRGIVSSYTENGSVKVIMKKSFPSS